MCSPTCRWKVQHYVAASKMSRFLEITIYNVTSQESVKTQNLRNIYVILPEHTATALTVLPPKALKLTAAVY